MKRNILLTQVVIFLIVLCFSWVYDSLSEFPPDKIQVKAVFVRMLENEKTEDGKHPVVFEYTVDFMPDSTYSTLRYLHESEVLELYKTKRKNIEVSLFSVNEQLHLERKNWELFGCILLVFVFSLFVHLHRLFLYKAKTCL